MKLTLKDLQKKSELIKNVTEGSSTIINILSFTLDKENFISLYNEAGKPNLHNPTKSVTDSYWYIINLNNISFIINYEPEIIKNYEPIKMEEDE